MEFNQLPDDAIMHIFSFLGIEELLDVSEVCSRWWNLVACCKSIWRDVYVNYSLCGSMDDFNRPLAFLKRAPMLGSLNLSCLNYHDKRTKTVISSLLKFKPQVLHLVVSHCMITDKNLSDIIECLKNNLVELHLMNITITWTKDLKPLSGSFPNVKVFELTGMDSVTESKLLHGCNTTVWPKLEEIHAGSVFMRNSLAFDFLNQFSIENRIRELSVHFDYIAGICGFFDMVFSHFLKLEKLSCFYDEGGDSKSHIKWKRDGERVSLDLDFNQIIPGHLYDSDCALMEKALQEIKVVDDLTFKFSFNVGLYLTHLLKALPDELTNITLISNCSSWKHFMDGSVAKINSRFFAQILSKFPQLKRMCIKGCNGLLNFEISELRSRFPKVCIDFEIMICRPTEENTFVSLVED